MMLMKKDLRTEEKILQVGRQLFSKRGYVATSMSDIATEVGITKASLYYFFKNKQALYFKLLLDLLDQVSEIYDADPAQDPENILKTTILQSIKISQTFGSMLQNAHHSPIDTASSEFRKIIERQQILDKKMQSFLRKCGVAEPKISSHILNSSTHGYIQRVLFGIEDISAVKYASHMSHILIKK